MPLPGVPTDGGGGGGGFGGSSGSLGNAGVANSLVGLSSVSSPYGALNLTYAKLAQGVYDGKDFMGVDGFRRVATWNHADTGLQAMLFKRADLRVLVFAGTNPNEWADYIADGMQAFGLGSAQYRDGIDIAMREAEKGGTLHFVGHSLGGGIAAAAAIMTNGSATTFKMAGLNKNTLNGVSMSRGTITHFQSSLDIMRAVNAVTPVSVPGTTISVGFGGFHGIGPLVRAMGG